MAAPTGLFSSPPPPVARFWLAPSSGWKEIWRRRCPSLALMASRCLRGDHYLRLGAHGPQPGKRAGAKWALCPACPRRAHHGLRHNGWTIRRRVDEPSTKLRAGPCSGQPVDLVGLRRWTGGRRRSSPWCRSRAARAGRRGLRSNRMQQFKASLPSVMPSERPFASQAHCLEWPGWSPRPLS